MKITFLHELDTGFMAYALKPAFQALGHECIIIQGWHTHLESDHSRVDYLLKDIPIADRHILEAHFKDTDLFILRAGDALLHDSGVLPYITPYNAVYRLHGHDLTFLGRPYRLHTWRVNWHNKEPLVVTYPDPTFLPHLKTAPVYIERPIDLSVIPRKNRADPPFALTTPACPEKKGGNLLAARWHTTTIPLKLYSALPRDEALAIKAQCSFFIDNVNPAYKPGPYGMNSVEAWLLDIPVFSYYTTMSRAVCPDLPQLITHVTLDTIQDTIEHFETDRQRLKYAKAYGKRVHDPLTIAKQYLALATRRYDEQ